MNKDLIMRRNHVKILGSGSDTILLAHGFGTDQSIWRFIADSLSKQFKIVLFDFVGSGNSDHLAYDPERYRTLDGYAQDIIEIAQALNLNNVTFVGHSVSSMIGLIASIKAPRHFRDLVMLCPSPCFLNHPPDYLGGFDRADLDELMDLMDKNYISWANYLGPLAIGGQSTPELVKEMSDSIATSDPMIAKSFARAAFFVDQRHLLPKAKHPTLILQGAHDALASEWVGEYMQAHMPRSSLSVIEAEGHCLHLTHPELIDRLIIHFAQAAYV